MADSSAKAELAPWGRQYVCLMAEYNRWMNGKVYDVCAALPDAEMSTDHGAFFNSVLGTLNHLLYGDLAWFGWFRDGEPRATTPDQLLFTELADLSIARKNLDEEIIIWADEVTDDWLAAPFSYRSFIDGQERTFPAWVLVAHMFNHQTHHRGQLTTLLSQAGKDVGVTDLPFMPIAVTAPDCN